MEDANPITLSALQHWAYCPRQCGLIHLEQAFDDNLHTQRGQAVHALVDKPGVEERKGLRIERALLLSNDTLGLIGKADVVEFEPLGRARLAARAWIETRRWTAGSSRGCRRAGRELDREPVRQEHADACSPMIHMLMRERP